MTANLWNWLASTRTLQTEVYGIDLSNLCGDELADYISENALGLTDELHEALAEVRWKTWATNRGTLDRERFVSELVDAGHFLANLLVAVNVTDAEWQSRYREKQERNRQRQAMAGGYDSVATKCPECHRELDKPDSMRVYSTGFIVCSECDTTFGRVHPLGHVQSTSTVAVELLRSFIASQTVEQ
jgi:hypothetical protein